MKINIFESARRLTKLIAVIWVLGMSFYVFTHETYIPAYFRVDSSDSVPIRMSEQERCDENDAEEYLSQYTSKGSKISMTLCFKPYVDKESDWVDVPAGHQVKTQPQQPKIYDELPDGAVFIDELPEKKKPVEYKKFDKLPEGFTPYEPAKQQQAQQPQQRILSFEEWKVIGKPTTILEAKQKKIAAKFKFSKADEEWADGVAWSERLGNIKFGAAVTIGGLAFLWIFSWCVGWIVRGFAGIPTGQDFKS
ncbi:MAG: hypothetical protein NTW85_01005 [Methylococcales bacterium]|nr:hypothetical protein [Methylococcales bacterium]